MIDANIAAVLYLVSGVLFILALRGLSSPASSRQGNTFGMVGMAIAIVTTLAVSGINDWLSWVLIIAGIALGGGIGAYMARTVKMTDMPQLVAAFHSLVGLAAVFVAAGALYAPEAFGIGEVGHIHTQALIEMSIGVAIGAFTFTGSVIAFAKLNGNMSGAPIILPQRHLLNIVLGLAVVALIVVLIVTHGLAAWAFWGIFALALVLGITLIIPIGGADMPVVVSMLNSYSGWAAAAAGFMLSNDLLIITGALVGSSGAILSYIMCRGMNRSIVSVILGGFGAAEGAAPGSGGAQAPAGEVRSITADKTADLLRENRKIVIVPGYGMAVAQAQHALADVTRILRAAGISVRFAIHPVAGRLPGHMNVLLAEANVPYDIVLEMEEINESLGEVDTVLVIGANDIVNPSAMDDPASPIAGMPVLHVWKAKNVIVMKRGMASGYAGVENPLFYRDNTLMLFGDAKKNVDAILTSLRSHAETAGAAH